MTTRLDTPGPWTWPVLGGFSCVLFVALLAISVRVHLRSVLSLDRSTGTLSPYLQRAWRVVDDLPHKIAQFDTVFWEPRDTESLRKRIVESDWLRGKSVLEIGTGTGLVAIYCLGAGAGQVVATDINPAAVANARFNANEFGVSDRFEARLVSVSRPTAFSVIRANERFDLIVSNPPWENDRPRSIAEFALYDPSFQLLHSLLANAKDHLHPGGRLWLAYGCTEALREILENAEPYGWQVQWLDDRRLEDLPEVFLPGLLLELVPIEPALGLTAPLGPLGVAHRRARPAGSMTGQLKSPSAQFSRSPARPGRGKKDRWVGASSGPVTLPAGQAGR